MSRGIEFTGDVTVNGGVTTISADGVNDIITEYSLITQGYFNANIGESTATQLDTKQDIIGAETELDCKSITVGGFVKCHNLEAEAAAFEKLPTCSLVPTLDDDLVNKSYADSIKTSLIGTASEVMNTLGELEEAIALKASSAAPTFTGSATFSSAPTMSGANIQQGSIPLAAINGLISGMVPAYLSTFRYVSDQYTSSNNIVRFDGFRCHSTVYKM